jgi:hypothetical protein
MGMHKPASTLLALAVCVLAAAPAAWGSANELRARHDQLQDQLRDNPFRKPLHLDSKETSSNVEGDIHAVLSHPFAKVRAALERPEHWCDILMLQFNTKQCRAAPSALNVRIGAKNDDTPEQAYPLNFAYRVAASNAEFLEVHLDADHGPLSTRDYRILLEATPLPGGRTFLRLAYSYGFGVAGRLAMQTYLGTVGAGKVGFSETGKQADGKPRYVGGMRGVIERNSMRYYLGIEAVLGALDVPREQRAEKAMRDWFAATELYPRQLHEISREEYLAMKRKEYAPAIASATSRGG